MAYALYLSKKLQVITVRFFNIVVLRQSGAFGMVLPRFVGAALKNLPIQVYGNGTQKRVFCHVKDAVTAINELSKKPKSYSQVYNIGGTEEVSILQLANLVIHELNSKSKIVFNSYDQAYGQGFEDMERRVPDLTKIRNDISWNPRVSLTEIIKDVAENFY